MIRRKVDFFIGLISLSSLEHTFNFQYTHMVQAVNGITPAAETGCIEEQGTMAAKWFTVTHHAGPNSIATLSMGTILFQQ
jgi:hypothetical protein